MINEKEVLCLSCQLLLSLLLLYLENTQLMLSFMNDNGYSGIG